MATNTDCSLAIDLTGLVGSVTANNSLWSGTWPTGNDPLFNYWGFGGGHPLWWKWTNTGSAPVLFQVDVTAHDFGINGALILGACGSPVDDTALANRNPIIINGSGGDIVVFPGQTVYLEMDYWTAFVDPLTQIEPPTPDPSTSYGAFTFTWMVRSVGLQDSIPSSTQTLTGISTDTPIDNIEAFTKIGSRFYYAWIVGNALYAGSCNLDGSSAISGMIDNTGIWPGSSNWVNNLVQICSDGTDIYLGFGSLQTVHTNPDDSVVGNFLICNGTSTLAGPIEVDIPQFHYVIYKQTGTSWTLWADLYENTAPLPLYRPGPFWGIDVDRNMVSRMTVDPNFPDYIYIVCSYAMKRRFWGKYHNNNLPVFGGCDERKMAITDHYFYEETFRISTDGVSPAERIAQNVETVNESYLSGFFPNINPIFGPDDAYSYGPWITDDGTTVFPIPGAEHMSLVSDVGYPLLFKCDPIGITNDNSKSFSNNITVQRLDTQAIVATYPYSDFSGVVDTDAYPATDLDGFISFSSGVIRGIWVSPLFLVGTAKKRYISTSWFSATIPFLANEIAANGTTTPTALDPSFPATSITPDFLMGIYNDGGGAWYGHTVDGVIYQYDYCTNTWHSVYNYTRDGLPHSYLWGYNEGSWIDAAFFSFTTDNDIRRHPIVRGTVLCTVGPPLSLTEIASIFWFFKEGVWYNSGQPDNPFELFMYKDGAWRQNWSDDEYQLFGQLEESWLN